MNPLIHFRKSIALSFIVLVLGSFTQKAQAGSPTPAMRKGKSAQAANAATKSDANKPSPVQALPIWNPCNTATGSGALSSNPTGWFNTADGCNALYNDTTGSQNTAVGAGALLRNTVGSDNTALGFDALFNNIGVVACPQCPLGHQNTAVGSQALFNNINANDNTAIGFQALYNNTGPVYQGVFYFQGGEGNTAVGSQALFSNSGSALNGIWNTAVGVQALYSNGHCGECFPNSNTGIGYSALRNNTAGDNNIALGYLGGNNLTTGRSNIDIGNDGVAGESSTIRIGSPTGLAIGNGKQFPPQTRTFIAGIRGVTTTNADAVAVVIDSAGQLGTVSSSERFKKDIGPMDKASEAILALKPVRFHYKDDTKGIPQFGLIAEDVAKVNPDLIVRDEKGEIYTVRYDAVNAMLLNEFLKEHRKVEEQEHTVAELKSGMEALAATVKEQAAQIQKVSAQIEMQKPPAQTVANNQ